MSIRATAHWWSHRSWIAKQRLARKNKKSKKQYKVALKMARNKLSILQCSAKLKTLKGVWTAIEIQPSIWLGTWNLAAQARDSAFGWKWKIRPYLKYFFQACLFSKNGSGNSILGILLQSHSPHWRPHLEDRQISCALD